MSDPRIADPTKPVPLVREKSNLTEISWSQAIVLNDCGESFDLVVNELYHRLEKSCEGHGKVGAASEFDVQPGKNIKLRCVIPFRNRHSAVCDFLAIRVGSDISISFGKGTHKQFNFFSNLAWLLITVLTIASGVIWLGTLAPIGSTDNRLETHRKIHPIAGYSAIVFGVTGIFLMVREKKHYPEDLALASSATEPVALVFFKVIDEWKPGGQKLRSRLPP